MHVDGDNPVNCPEYPFTQHQVTNVVNRIGGSDPLRDEAVRWLLRLHSPECTEAERLACDRWLMKSPLNREAFARVEAQWQWMDQIKVHRLSVREEALSYRPARKRRSLRPIIGLAMAASVLLALGWTAFTPNGWIGAEATYLAEKSRRNTVTLADGSRLELNTDTEVKVRINRWRRRVYLMRGEAFFTVVHDASRPFEVRAGGGRVTDLGTAFEVYLQAERVLVAVQEGRVKVEAAGSRELVAGQQISYGRRGDFAAVAAQDVAELTAWRQGKLIFHDRPLNEVLAEIGRYHDTTLRVSDPAQSRLRVSGAFATDNLDNILGAIAMTLPVKVDRIGAQEIVLSPKGKR